MNQVYNLLATNVTIKQIFRKKCDLERVLRTFEMDK